MITSLLIANRGEIARRIIRTARRMGVRTIAVYSEADANTPHVEEADEAVLIGPAPARESYLVAEKILAAAKATGAEAIHPGYGFLSENAAFARAVKAAGLIWVGPPADAIDAMGLKDAAKRRMQAAGVPVTPGYMGEDQSLERLQAEADKTGYPVLIKAVAGGGGKGMRKVEAAGDFAAALASCQREAASSFGDDKVLIEKYVTRPRHIEVQVFGDSHGNAVHLFERDCSLQRRHQKVIEEAPAPGMDAATRAAVCDAAVKAARAVNYEGAGTVEFIADASEGLRADRIWFMEMNTRLQVEHPVTEAITGQDLVEWQLRVASGEPLPLRQEELSINGWAMEARLYAENPATGFLPSTGRIEHRSMPFAKYIRIDSAIRDGSVVTPYYDPMIAKVIVNGSTREEAAERLAAACSDVEVWPVKTNAAFLARCASDPDFIAGRIDTGFIEARLEQLVARSPASDLAVVTAAAKFLSAAEREFVEGAGEEGNLHIPYGGGVLSGFRVNAPAQYPITVYEDGVRHDVAVRGIAYRELYRSPLVYGGREWVAEYGSRHSPDNIQFGKEMLGAYDAGDGQIVVFEEGQTLLFTRVSGHGSGGGGASDGAIRSPMPGKIVSVSVKAGDTVTKGQPLLVLEAMKMEHAMTAPFDGVVIELNATAGGQVSEGVVLAKLEAAS